MPSEPVFHIEKCFALSTVSFALGTYVSHVFGFYILNDIFREGAVIAGVTLIAKLGSTNYAKGNIIHPQSKFRLRDMLSSNQFINFSISTR